MAASQWKLIWWKFRKHKLAMYSAVVVIAIYTVALVMEFFGLPAGSVRCELHLRAAAGVASGGFFQRQPQGGAVCHRIQGCD